MCEAIIAKMAPMFTATRGDAEEFLSAVLPKIHPFSGNNKDCLFQGRSDEKVDCSILHNARAGAGVSKDIMSEE